MRNHEDDAAGGAQAGEPIPQRMRRRVVEAGEGFVEEHEPRLVLLDEPFTGLDDAATHALRDRLAGLRTAGCIVLVITHDLETIDGIADRALMLQNGRLEAIPDGPAPLRARYRAAMSAVSERTVRQ